MHLVFYAPVAQCGGEACAVSLKSDVITGFGGDFNDIGTMLGVLIRLESGFVALGNQECHPTDA